MIGKKTGRIIMFCLLCAGVGLLILAVLSTIDLIQLRVFGRETNGYVIRQEIEQESIERYEDEKEFVVNLPRHTEKARIQQEISGFRGIFGPLMLFVFGAVLIGTSRLVNLFT